MSSLPPAPKYQNSSIPDLNATFARLIAAPFTLCPELRAECAALLDGPDAPPLSAEQKDGMIDALWSLVTAFADLAYRSDSVATLAAESCGQSEGRASEGCAPSEAMLKSSHHHATIIAAAASQDAADKGES